MDGHQVEHPRRLLVERARPAGTENRLPFADNLGLHKQIAERGMQRVRGRRGEDDFRVARDVDRPARPRTVGDADAAELDIIFRRDRDLGMRVDIVVAPPEFRPPLGENHFVAS